MLQYSREGGIHQTIVFSHGLMYVLHVFDLILYALLEKL